MLDPTVTTAVSALASFTPTGFGVTRRPLPRDRRLNNLGLGGESDKAAEQANFPVTDEAEEVDVENVDLEKVKAEIEANKDKKQFREIFYKMLARRIENCRGPLILKEYS